MATTIVVDPLTRIEGHNRFTVTIETSGGTVTEANSSGTLFRGFENILSGRDPRDAPQITQRICGVCPTAHAMASVRAVDDALNVQVPKNGIMVRNIIHGSDTLMSHITHFYHLSALDFVDASLLGSPWNPTFGNLSTCGLVSALTRNPYSNQPSILHSYVEALNIRRECHTMAAIFGGRFPIQNALVPGGVATIFTQSDIDKFKTHINNVRNFINLTYLPDVAFVATQNNINGDNWLKYWGVGTTPGNLLSYGEYPTATYARWPDDGNAMLLSRGVYYGSTTHALDLTQITEFVNYSYYESADNNLHPSAGTTHPRIDYVGTTALGGPYGQYSWLKAPRYSGMAMEVGPLARMFLTYKNAPGAMLSQAGSASCTALGIGATYSVADLVNNTFATANALASPTVLGAGNLFSPLGRHLCRALESKVVADAMGADTSGWLYALTLDTTTGLLSTPVGTGYSYVKIPKPTSMGTGLAEVPRGSLGHWITIQSKKIGRYQCVVPTTWNASPKGTSSTNYGPAESVLYNLAAMGTTGSTNDAVLNIARMLHPYDFCIACAVHLVTPDGKNIAKFNINDAGKITKIPADSE